MTSTTTNRSKKMQNRPPVRPNPQSANNRREQPPARTNSEQQQMDITERIKETIYQLKRKPKEGAPEEKGTLQNYPIRDLVKHAEEFGPYLKQQRLETNQVRKFLDAVNRLKADLAQENDFAKIETEVVLLKPKLAYAAARQRSAKPLSDVMSAAIDQVHSKEDFERLVQLVESIIAYHKAEGGK